MDRRQFLQTLSAGSSMAGLLTLAIPRSALAHVVRHGNVVSLSCVAGKSAATRFLDGRTRDGTVGFAPELSSKFSGTKWKVFGAGTGAVSFKCLGLVEGKRWLEGRTADGTVGLARDRGPGTVWRVDGFPDSPTNVVLECLRDPKAHRWLFGQPANGTIRLTPSLAPPYTGTRWDVLMYPVCIDEPCDPWFLREKS